jgi:hypothetical protein
MTKLDKNFDLDRNPSNYEASTHLIQRMRERDFLEADIITEAIEVGKVVKADGNDGGSDEAVKLRYEWLQSTFEVVLCPKDMVVQTAYEVEA